MIQRSSRVDLVPPTSLTMRLTRRFLWSFLKRTYQDGYYSLDAIEEALNIAYPLVELNRPVISRQMLAFGYGQMKWSQDFEKWVPFGKGYQYLGEGKPHFHVILHRNLAGAQ